MAPERDFEASGTDHGSFSDFVDRTRDETTRTAYALTGSIAEASMLAARAYARVLSRWGRLEGAAAGAFLRASLLRAARGVVPEAHAVEAVHESGWPLVDVPLPLVEDLSRRETSRRRLLGLLGVGLGAGAAGLTGWQVLRAVSDGKDDASTGGPGAAVNAGFQPLDSRAIVVNRSLTVEADLLLDHTGARHLAVRRGAEPIATVRLSGGRQLVRLPHPSGPGDELFLAICDPASWVHLRGSYHEPLTPRVQLMGDMTVAIGSAPDAYDYDTLVAGTASEVTVWPGDRGEGLRWTDEPDLWVYRLNGECSAHHQGAARGSSHHRDFPELQTIRLADGGLVFAVDGTDVEVIGQPTSALRYLQYGYVGHRPPPSGAPPAVLRWKDSDGKPHAVPLDDRL